MQTQTATFTIKGVTPLVVSRWRVNCTTIAPRQRKLRAQYIRELLREISVELRELEKAKQ